MNELKIFFKLIDIDFFWFIIVLSIKNLNLVLIGSDRVKYSLRIFCYNDVIRIFEKRLNFKV